MKLSWRELFILDKIATKSKMDTWFVIDLDGINNHFVEDIEEGKTLSLHDGISMLHEGVTSLDDYGVTEEQKKVYYRLLDDLGIPYDKQVTKVGENNNG